jgi:acetoin utilization deacetylase AcuC-like enzyme
VHNANHIIHRSEVSSPENPTRLVRIMNFLEGRLRLFERPDCALVTGFPPATEEQLRLVHDAGYIRFVQNYCERGGGFLGDSTYLAQNSFKAALSAVGAVVQATRLVASGEHDTSFALVRPPGHHASTDSFGGYCIFNNAAVASRVLQKEGLADKVMIVDIDAHAGNGTMRIFYEDPTVLNLSLHRDPHGFYPHDGFIHQIGRGKGRGTNINMEMPENCGDEEYLYVLENLIEPVYSEYKPDFLICLVGFDSHYTDTQCSLQLTGNGYYEFVRRLKEMNDDKLTVTIEGGYNTTENVNLAHMIVFSLLGEEPPYDDTLDGLSTSMMREVKTRTLLEEKMRELKELLSDYYHFEDA